MKRILAYGYTGCLLLFIFLSLAIKFSFLDDYGPVSLQTVMSGIMQPTIPTGSLVIVKKTPFEKVTTGDIVTFSQGPSYVTHRVIGVEPTHVITQGDNNNTADSEPVKSILGKVVFHLPKLGHWLMVSQTKQGLLAISCTFVSIWLMLLFVQILLKKDPQGDDYV